MCTLSAFFLTQKPYNHFWAELCLQWAVWCFGVWAVDMCIRTCNTGEYQSVEVWCVWSCRSNHGHGTPEGLDMFELSCSTLTGSNLCLATWIKVFVKSASKQGATMNHKHTQPNAEEIWTMNLPSGLRTTDWLNFIKSLIDTWQPAQTFKTYTNAPSGSSLVLHSNSKPYLSRLGE